MINLYPLFVVGLFATAFDLLLPIINKQGKRISDYIFGSLVIDELPNRKEVLII